MNRLTEAIRRSGPDIGLDRLSVFCEKELEPASISTQTIAGELHTAAHRFAIRPSLVKRWLQPADRASWLTSRKALLSAVSEQPSGERLHASIAHCPGAGLAIAHSEFEHLLGLGVDLEPGTRSVSMALKFRMESSAEVYEADPLELWCLLEACYKADPTEPKSGIFTYRYDENYRFLSKSHRFRCASGIDEGFRWAIAACYPR